MSSELALYRKYRPETFKEVVGQSHVVSVLEAAIKNNQIAHAYLFSGSHGTGKTSIARIFARAIGCVSVDIYEIDAASNRGIENMRELRDVVQTRPFQSPYKVYIIDEVHMLSKDAFNAFLKTLEEPPPHVVFILATTEFDKLPDTIVSRCQTFRFKKPSEEEIRAYLSRVAKEEKLKLDKESINLIALLGEGSFRDAIGMLQKVATVSSDKAITIDEVEKITGAPRSSLVRELLLATVATDADKAISVLNDAVRSGVEINVLLKMLLHELRTAMLLMFAPTLEKRIAEEHSTSELAFLRELGKLQGAQKLPGILKELLLAHEETRRAYIKQLPLELALLKIGGKSGGDLH